MAASKKLKELKEKQYQDPFFLEPEQIQTNLDSQMSNERSLIKEKQVMQTQTRRPNQITNKEKNSIQQFVEQIELINGNQNYTWFQTHRDKGKIRSRIIKTVEKDRLCFVSDVFIVYNLNEKKVEKTIDLPKDQMNPAQGFFVWVYDASPKQN